MGLFNNYMKPGPGIDKDAPKKKGIFLYLELIWRKLGKLFLSNMLYVLVSIPVILIYHFVSFYILSSIISPEEAQSGVYFNQLVLLATALLTIFWGTGPVTCGYTFLLRNFAREQHVWLSSDFFEHTRKNFKQSIILFLVDIVVLITGVNAIYFYWQMSATVPAMKYLSLFLVGMMFVYTFMHYYMYEFLITFKLTTKEVYKNSLILAFGALPMNVFLTVFVLIVTVLFFSILTPIAIILVVALFWVSFMRFPIDFYAARLIKRQLIDGKNEESDE